MKTHITNRRTLFYVYCLGLAMVCFLCWPQDIRADNNAFHLTIVHVNDTHAHLAPTEMPLLIGGQKVYLKVGGFARLASKVAAVRKDSRHCLVLHAGDVFQGTIYFTRYGGMADAELMNLIGFDAMAAGNHEFDKGPDVLARFVKAAAFPVLAANIDASRDITLAGLLLPCVVKVFDGEKVAIFGLAPRETPWISSPGKHLFFGDPVRTARDMVRRLEAQGINKIVLLSHIGYDQDITLAKAVDGIDVIVGGHSHTLLGDFHDIGLMSKGPYPTRLQTPSGDNVFVVQAWEWAKIVGRLEVFFDGNGIVTKCQGNPVIISGDTFWTKNRQGLKVPLSQARRARLLQCIASSGSIEIVAEAKDAKNKLAFYDKGIEALQSQVIATATEDLLHTRIPGSRDKNATDLAVIASQLGPLVAQAMLWKAHAAGFAVQLVFQNAGGIRADIRQGPITAAQAYEVLPFGNTLYLIKLKGKAIRTTLVKAVSRAGGAFPYVAGMRYRAKRKRHKGYRVTGIEVRNNQGAWKPLDDNATYLVGTNSYLANGGNGYQAFKHASSYRYDTGFVDAKIFIEYARHLGVLHRPEETGVMLR